MKVEKLGRLERIDLREVFSSEFGDFTPCWLTCRPSTTATGAVSS